MLPLLLLAALAQQPASDMPAIVPGALEGRPPASQLSPIQTLIDRARPGETVTVPAGVYDGDLIIDRPIRLAGQGRPLLRGSGTGSVVRVRADDVTIEGFEIDGLAGGDLGRDPAGIHVTGHRVVIRDCRIRNALFGIYLREANGATVERSFVRGVPGKAPGEKGSGIHIWNTDGFTLIENEVVDARDGLYIQSSPNGRTLRNYAHDLRYGLHYMFSDDNLFEDNRFENAAAGTAIMYSKRIVFRRNQFLRNRGFASVGLLFKTCDDVVAEDNLIADNARGIFIEGSYRDVFRRNVIAQSDTAIVLYDTEGGHRFEQNSFVANLSPLFLVGKHTDTLFRGNYWSDNTEPDLDGDGYSDRPYRLSNVFDHLRGNLMAADLFAQGFAASAIGMAERTFPVLNPIPVVDERPLARAPVLPQVPVAPPEGRRAAPWGLAASAASLLAGLALFGSGRRGRIVDRQ
jgi:nitrous oxidase accessory protein